jgi:hypothetical protein
MEINSVECGRTAFRACEMVRRGDRFVSPSRNVVEVRSVRMAHGDRPIATAYRVCPRLQLGKRGPIDDAAEESFGSRSE